METMEYNARIEYETREDITDDLMAALIDHHPAITRSGRGWIEAHITLPAETLRQAVTTALAIADSASNVAVLAIEVLPTAEFDARVDLEAMPELVSVTDAAELLGVSRSAVLQRLESGSLPGTKVGKTWVLQKGAIAPSRHRFTQEDVDAIAEAKARRHKDLPAL